MHLNFKAFRAINELELCLKYKAEHQNVLKDYGITNITTNNDEWMHNPDIYCVVALNEDGTKILGGVRAQISTEKTLLPVEMAIGKMDARIHDMVKKYRNNGGVGELCALWNAKMVAGMGLSVLLTRAGIAITNQLEITTLMGICADYTLKMFKQVGFVVDSSLGENGGFPYPNPSYTARVLGIMNAASLETAAEYDKKRMSSLRNNPIQIAIENEQKEEIVINYDLTIKK